MGFIEIRALGIHELASDFLRLGGGLGPYWGARLGRVRGLIAVGHAAVEFSDELAGGFVQLPLFRAILSRSAVPRLRRSDQFGRENGILDRQADTASRTGKAFRDLCLRREREGRELPYEFGPCLSEDPLRIETPRLEGTAPHLLELGDQRLPLPIGLVLML
jgi:hypothetical protein